MPQDITFNENIAGMDSSILMTQEQFDDAVNDIFNQEDEEYEFDKAGKFKQNVDKLIFGMRAKTKNNFSQVGAVSSIGMNGLGKSHLLWQCTSEIAKEKANIKRNFFFIGGLNEIKEKTDKLPIADVLCVDEFLGLVYKRRAMTKDVIDFNEWLGKDQRKTQVILLGAIPDFWDLDAYLRKKKVDYYLECLSRGVAIRFLPDRMPHTDPWHEEEFIKIQKKKRKRMGLEELNAKTNIMQKHMCYAGLIFWRKMPDAVFEEYKFEVDKAKKLGELYSNPEDVLEKWKQEFILKQAGETYRLQKAILGLGDALKLRGTPKTQIYKQAGISEYEFEKIDKDVRKKEVEMAEKIIRGEIKLPPPQPITG